MAFESCHYTLVPGNLLLYINRCEAMTEIKETASYLLELAVCDNFFISKKPSSISRAAILAAMDIVARPLRVNVLMENLLAMMEVIDTWWRIV